MVIKIPSTMASFSKNGVCKDEDNNMHFLF